jgi:hypothetical protein
MGLFVVNDEIHIDGDGVAIFITTSCFTNENNVDDDDDVVITIT